MRNCCIICTKRAYVKFQVMEKLVAVRCVRLNKTTTRQKEIRKPCCRYWYAFCLTVQITTGCDGKQKPEMLWGKSIVIQRQILQSRIQITYMYRHAGDADSYQQSYTGLQAE